MTPSPHTPSPQLGLLPGRSAAEIMQGSYRRFYPHSVGHWLGLDTHDSSSMSHDRPLEPGGRGGGRATLRLGAAGGWHAREVFVAGHMPDARLAAPPCQRPCLLPLPSSAVPAGQTSRCTRDAPLCSGAALAGPPCSPLHCSLSRCPLSTRPAWSIRRGADDRARAVHSRRPFDVWAAGGRRRAHRGRRRNHRFAAGCFAAPPPAPSPLCCARGAE